jgi:hypothetical protein
MSTKREKKITMEKVMDDPRYRGYHVIVIAGKVFKARTGQGASKILAEARQKYPGQIPEITYLPDADSLILWF